MTTNPTTLTITHSRQRPLSDTCSLLFFLTITSAIAKPASNIWAQCLSHVKQGPDFRNSKDFCKIYPKFVA